MNFTSNYLGLLKKMGKFSEITDGTIVLSTIRSEEEPEGIVYSAPKIIYDKFEEKEELVEPDIRTITRGLQTIRELGFEIVSISVGKKKWFRKQSTQYKLRRISLISDASNVTNIIPLNHYIEYDRANQRIRMIGKNCRNDNKIGVTEWLKV